MAGKKKTTQKKAKTKETPTPPEAVKKRTRKKTAPKRTRREREASLVRIAAYHVRGITQAEIAAKEGVSQQAISRDIADIRQRWRESTVIDYAEFINKHMLALDEMEREHWQAWDRSKDSLDGCGDPRFLDGIRKCWIDRRDTIGYGAAQKVDATVSQGPSSGMTEAEIDARLREFYEAGNAKAGEANDE